MEHKQAPEMFLIMMIIEMAGIPAMHSDLYLMSLDSRMTKLEKAF